LAVFEFAQVVALDVDGGLFAAEVGQLPIVVDVLYI
jgi:hypothetical protein